MIGRKAISHDVITTLYCVFFFSLLPRTPRTATVCFILSCFSTSKLKWRIPKQFVHEKFKRGPKSAKKVCDEWLWLLNKVHVSVTYEVTSLVCRVPCEWNGAENQVCMLEKLMSKLFLSRRTYDSLSLLKLSHYSLTQHMINSYRL